MSASTHETASTAQGDGKERGRRKTRIGQVVSDKMTQSVTVLVTRLVRHPIYNRVVRRTQQVMAHDGHVAALSQKARQEMAEPSRG